MIEIFAKTIKFLACFLVMLIFIGGVCLSTGEQDHPAAKFIGMLNMVGAVVFGLVGIRILRGKSYATQGGTINELEIDGVIRSEEVQAKRAIQIEESEDEGSHYLVELLDGAVICLSGQYLYQHEGGEDESGNPTSRRFPNTRFQIKRHLPTNEVWDIACLGNSFEPLQIFSEYVSIEFEGDLVPFNGDIFRNIPFENFLEFKGRLPREPYRVFHSKN